MDIKTYSIIPTCNGFGENKSYSTTSNSIENFSMQIVSKRNDVFILAKAFLSISPMTHKKLQKLCYYAKAWYLALFDENIIEESFEAWVHGAVQPSLYQIYKDYGFERIPLFKNSEVIPEEFMSFAKDIYDAYGELSGDELEAINHQEEPWLNARRGLKPWERGNRIISEEDMKSFYRAMITNEHT